MDLDNCINLFNQVAAKFASVSESAAFNNLAGTAKRYVNEPEFQRYLGHDLHSEGRIDELRQVIFELFKISRTVS